ncbi:diguanylate cyclase domain-containing protein [Methylophilus sp. QUAN]|uniref:sensor domain-containing diguanylate cyclase n=1 Tax=Methylophilus sp. QUAN TaxID=2781020 RepID=UPI00188FA818|nr:diguanylate cyclase [Methylophilus sp. QUAN]MBF4992133.1 diguanylate cyclase [Methylophilus sp. QUAN]
MLPGLPTYSKSIRFSLALVVIYIITGKLGLMLAVPPGYASAIFPPAGIAIAVSYLLGKRIIPAIFAGSLILNLWVDYSTHHHFSQLGLVVALLIAVASSLQARLGGAWLRRNIAFPTTLDAPADVVRFLVSAPLLCLVSASVSVAGLLALGLIDQHSVLASWVSWWVGDFLGLIVMLPLTLVMLGQPRALWKKRLQTVAVPMLLLFSLLVAAFVTASKWERKESLTEFDSLASQLSEQLRVRLESQEAVLAQISALFTYQQSDVSQEDFHNFVKVTLDKYPMIYALEWVPKISHARRDSFIAEMQSEFPGFYIKQPGENNQWQAVKDRSYYFPLTYIEPANAQTQRTIGFDLASMDNRKITLLQAFKQNKAAVTSPIKLYLSSGRQMGLLLMYPVHGHRYDGVVQTVLISKDFFGAIFARTQPLLNVRLVEKESQAEIYVAMTDQASDIVFSREFRFGDKHYRLDLSPSARYYAEHRGWQSWSMLAVGIFCTGLVGAILLMGTGYTARVVAQVNEKTLALKESAARFQEITDTLGEGIYVTDMSGVITFINPEALRLLDWRKRDLIGKSAHALFHYKKVDHSHYAEHECLLCNVMNSGQAVKTSDEVLWRRDGQPIHIDVTSVPIIRDQQVCGAVVVFDDISNRKKTESALRASEKSFREIMEFAPIGMAIVSLEGRFTKVNQALCNIVGYSNDALVATTFQEITHADDLAKDLEYVQQLLDGKINAYQMEKRYIRRDKAVVWVQLSVSIFRDEEHAPQYFIAQIEDITARKHQYDEVTQEAYFDALTGLPNRRMLLSRLHQVHARLPHATQSAALLFLDIDHFKQINDTLGHDVGDVILKEVSTRLQGCLRQSDTVSRLGGDEFVMLLPELTQRDDAEHVAQKILNSFVLPVQVNERSIHIGVSIGLAVCAAGTQVTVTEWMKQADIAMYEAKGAGRNGYHVYSA